MFKKDNYSLFVTHLHTLHPLKGFRTNHIPKDFVLSKSTEFYQILPLTNQSIEKVFEAVKILWCYVPQFQQNLWHHTLPGIALWMMGLWNYRILVAMESYFQTEIIMTPLCVNWNLPQVCLEREFTGTSHSLHNWHSKLINICIILHICWGHQTRCIIGIQWRLSPANIDVNSLDDLMTGVQSGTCLSATQSSIY